MFFGKSAAQKQNDIDAVVIAAQRQAIKKLNAEIARTGVLLTTYRKREGMLGRQNSNLIAENHRLTAELARLTTRGPGGRFVKVAKPNGTTEAAGQGAH